MFAQLNIIPNPTDIVGAMGLKLAPIIAAAFTLLIALKALDFFHGIIFQGQTWAEWKDDYDLETAEIYARSKDRYHNRKMKKYGDYYYEFMHTHSARFRKEMEHEGAAESFVGKWDKSKEKFVADLVEDESWSDTFAADDHVRPGVEVPENVYAMRSPGRNAECDEFLDIDDERYNYL